MNKKALLTIAIPTFNRSEILQKSLSFAAENICRQDIEIFVSDNCSTDSTKYTVKDIQKKYSSIRYTRQKQNIGDLNFVYLLTESTSEYVWLLADRTIFHPDKLKKLYKYLKLKKYDIIILNDGNRRVKDITDREYDNSNELLSDIGWHMTQLSTLVLSRKLIQQIDYNRYSSTNFIHTAGVFDALALNKFRALWLNDSFFENKFHNTQSGWVKDTFKIFFDIWASAILSLPPTYPLEIKFKCIRDHGIKSGLFSLKGIIEMRAQSIYTFSIFRKYRRIFCYFTNISKLLLLCTAIIPSPLFRILIRTYKKLFK